MVKVGDELSGRVTEASVVMTRNGERALIRIAPLVARNDGVDVTAAGTTTLWCSARDLASWYRSEEPRRMIERSERELERSTNSSDRLSD